MSMLSNDFRIMPAPIFEVTMFPSLHTGLVIPEIRTENRGTYIRDSHHYIRRCQHARQLAVEGGPQSQRLCKRYQLLRLGPRHRKM